MKRNPAIDEVMTVLPFTIEGTAPLREAKQLMAKHEIRHLPVTLHGELFGILSERDLKLAQSVAGEESFDGVIKVQDLCQVEVYVVDRAAALADVLAYMSEQHIGSTLVLDHDILCGIFTVTDACRAFAHYLHQTNKA